MMERVVFLLEESGERLACMLNPESLVFRRRAGIRQRQAGGGLVSANRLSDDALIYTGGGSTSIEMNLVFDVTIGGSSITTEDVRDLTGPLWRLAENETTQGSQGGRGSPAICRLVWGKSWNVPAVVSAVSERLEYFTAEGVPRRSWLRMRLLRCDTAVTSESQPLTAPSDMQSASVPASLHEVLGTEAAGHEAGSVNEPLSLIAFRETGDAANWREFGLDNPFSLTPGQLLEIPGR